MQPISATSFCGHVVRETRFKYDREAHKSTRVTTTEDEFLKSYDRQKEKIESFKQFAIKLDTLMHKDPEIQQAIKELPENFEIELGANCSFNANGNEHEIELGSPSLIADEDYLFATKKAQTMDRDKRNEAVYLSCEYIADGPNKQQILDWLKNLNSFFK